MHDLIAIETLDDVPAAYRDTPIARLLAYHNLGAELDVHDRAELLIGMCMDNRKQLRIPENFAFIIRAGGGNLRYSEFKVSFAIGVGGVRAVALIGHSDCGMVNVTAREDAFVAGLVENAGVDAGWAREHFLDSAHMFEIGDARDFTVSEATRLRLRYPKILVAPLHYRVEDNRLYLIRE